MLNLAILRLIDGTKMAVFKPKMPFCDYTAIQLFNCPKLLYSDSSHRNHSSSLNLAILHVF